MKFARDSRRLLGLGLGIVVVANVFILSAAAYNRSGEPSLRMTLNERELRLPHRYYRIAENSGLFLQLRWRMLPVERDIGASPFISYGSAPEWMNEEKLRHLGFNLSRPIDSPEGELYYRKIQPREVYLVLELDGPAYSEAIARAESNLARVIDSVAANPSLTPAARDRQIKNAEDLLFRERYTASRLFVIDAGTDSVELHDRYGEIGGHLILKGTVRPFVTYTDREPTGIIGRITRLSNQSVNVPLAHRAPLDALQTSRSRSRDDPEPRFEVDLALGKRHELWVESVNPM